MSVRHVVAQVGYAGAGIGAVVAGVVYLLSSGPMGYHLAAVRMPWDQLDPSVRTLVQALIKTTGGGMLAGGVAMICMWQFAFRARRPWSYFTLPAVGLILYLPALWVTWTVHDLTGAPTPRWLCVFAVALVVGAAAIQPYQDVRRQPDGLSRS
jgi:hypothetical protein